MVEAIQELVNGALIGSTYALIGIGFTLLWGFMGRYNMAYGATAIGAGFAAVEVHSKIPGLPVPALFVIAPLVGAVLGYLVHLLSFRFLPRQYVFAPLLSSLGLLFVIEELINRITEGRPQSVPPLLTAPNLIFGDFQLRLDYVAIAALSVLVVVALYRVLFGTRLGLSLRATAQQPTAAQLVGIDPVRVDAATFVFSGALAGLGGMLVMMGLGSAYASLATTYTVRGLAVAVIGGLGSIPGAIVGGVLVGVIDREAQNFLGVDYRDIFGFLALFAILILRPQGLLGRRER